MEEPIDALFGSDQHLTKDEILARARALGWSGELQDRIKILGGYEYDRIELADTLSQPHTKPIPQSPDLPPDDLDNTRLRREVTNAHERAQEADERGSDQDRARAGQRLTELENEYLRRAHR